MATAAPHVKLLRQLASAKDDYLSGAFDISWDGAKATLYLVFGRPSHAVFEEGQEQIEGEAAIDALLAALPRAFTVSDWRRAMSPHETLSITIDELAGPFVRLAGSYADDPVTDDSPEWWSAVDDSPDLPFGLADFPLLPGGRPLWVEASPDQVHLADRLAELPPSILILTGAKLRAAAVVSGGDLIDAVWLDADDHARGETAGLALLGATKGSLAGYALDDPRVAEALTMLWRLPMAVSGVELAWLDPASMLAAFRADGLDRVLVVDAPVRGIALFSRGGLVAVYSETQRSAVASPERLRSLLSQARGRLTVMERKPRPLTAETAAKPSAHEFFEVIELGPDAQTEVIAEPAAADAPEVSSDVEPIAAADAPDEATAVDDEPHRPSGFITQEADASAYEAGETAGAGSEPVTEAATGAVDVSEPPPPPPGDELAAGATEAPPPPPLTPETEEPTQKPKRSRWGFGRSRRSRAERHAAEAAAAAAEATASAEGGDAATFAGWSVRQPSPDTPPAWQRSHDTGPTSPPDADAEDGDPHEASASTWSLARSEDGSSVTPGPGETLGAPALDAPPPIDDEQHVAPLMFEDVPTSDSPDLSPEDAETEAPEARDAAAAFEFVAFDEPAPADEPVVEPTDETTPGGDSETWLSTSWLDDVVNGAAPATGIEQDATPDAQPATTEHDSEPNGDAVQHDNEEHDAATEPAHDAAIEPARDAEGEHEHAAASSPEAETVDPIDDAEDGAEEPRPAPVLRTPGPWSWPLAEPEEEAHSSASDLEPEPAAVAAPGREDTMEASDSDAEAGFFHRDEPVGSQYVDFDEVRNELVQIGIVWLGETNAVQVTALLSSTRSTIDDFVATIDTIRGLHLDGQDPASIQAMAREMHQQAAERLCGA
ncbi:MAG: hypothetical protein ACHQ4F_07230 [Candidatus Dormibacteria bacterium]